jgi:alpha-D-xyloside xylohydrolase
MAMSGHPFWSHDIGGFKGRPTPDLYIRWAQFGLFSPFSRAHGTTSRLPWDYGEEAERIVRDFVRLRYRLLPYIYSYSRVAASTGLPVMRPMVLEFPDDPATYSLDLQYMFGAELLAAPIYNNSGVRPVYFPSGQWIDYWTHEIIEGPQTRWATAPLDTMPLYVRGGALIPTMEPPQYIADEKPWPLVTLDAYIMRGGSFALHDSDGVTYVSVWLDGSHLNVQVNGPKKRLGLRLIALPGVPVVDTVLVKGETLARVQSLEGVTAGWVRDADGTVRALISVP